MERYIELVDKGINIRSNVVKLKDFPNVYRDYEAFYSMFIFGEEVLEHIETNISPKTGRPSIINYSGNHGMKFLWIDVDVKTDSVMKSVEQSVKDTKVIIEKLNSKYEVPFESIVIYFSGRKGFHIGIPSYCFGAENFMSVYTHKVAKNMVSSIMSDIGISSVDMVVYNTTRILRCPYSKHPNGYYKVQVSYKHILENNVERIIDLAKKNSTDVKYSVKKQRSSLLEKLFNISVESAQADLDLMENIKPEHNTYKINTSIFRIPESGTRNDSLYKMTYRLFCMPELKPVEIVDIMRIFTDVVNKEATINNIDKISDFEFRTFVNSAYNRARVKPVKRIAIDSLQDMAPEVFNHIRDLKSVPTGFSAWDEDLDGGFILGDLYSIIGRGGTIKSLITQIATTNASIDNDMAGIYFNMEMSKTEFFSRAMYRINKIAFKNSIKEGSFTEKDLEDLQYELDRKLKANYGVVSDNDLSPEDIKSIIQRRESDINKKIYWVILDSMNAMAMDGNEVSTAFKVTKKLKQVAKETNTAIILINHANQSCMPHTRDTSLFVRGGAKVIDNCDAYISMSKIIEPTKSNFNERDFVYKPNLFYTRFVNKRGSGNTFDKVLRVEDNLDVTHLDQDPFEFECFNN